MCTDHAGERVHAARIRTETDADKGLQELRVVCGIDEVTGKGEICRPARARTGDRTDHDLRHLLHVQHDLRQLACQRSHGLLRKIRLIAVRLHEADIAASAEGTPCACKHDDLHRLIRFRFFERAFHLERHVHVEGIQRRCVVQRDGRDGSLYRVVNHFVIHGNTSFLNQCFLRSLCLYYTSFEENEKLEIALLRHWLLFRPWQKERSLAQKGRAFLGMDWGQRAVRHSRKRETLKKERCPFHVPFAAWIP